MLLLLCSIGYEALGHEKKPNMFCYFNSFLYLILIKTPLVKVAHFHRFFMPNTVIEENSQQEPNVGLAQEPQWVQPGQQLKDTREKGRNHR